MASIYQYFLSLEISFFSTNEGTQRAYENVVMFTWTGHTSALKFQSLSLCQQSNWKNNRLNFKVRNSPKADTVNRIKYLSMRVE